METPQPATTATDKISDALDAVENTIADEAFEPPMDLPYPPPLTIEHREAGGTIHTIMRVDGVPFASYLPGTKNPAKAHAVAMLILAARFNAALDPSMLKSEFGVIPVDVDYGKDDIEFGFVSTEPPESETPPATEAPKKKTRHTT